MTFWNERSVKVNQKHRYKLQIGDLFWWVKTVKFPSISSEAKEFSEGVSAGKVFVKGTSQVTSFSVTFADVFLTNREDNSITYNCSTSAFLFWLYKALEAGVENQVVLLTESPSDVDPNFPFSQEFVNDNILISEGKIKTIKIIKFYGDDAKEGILAFKCLMPKIDFGQGDYSSGEINEITVDFQPDGFRIDTYVTDDEEGDTKQGITDNSSSPPVAQDTEAPSNPPVNKTTPQPKNKNQENQSEEQSTDTAMRTINGYGTSR